MSINAQIKAEVESDLAKFNATLFRQPDSIVLAQRYYYPVGSTPPTKFMEPQPEGTTKVRIFFAREEDQKAYCEAYPCTRPFFTESGCIKMLDQITSWYAEDYQDYKRKYWADFAPEDRP